MVSTQTRLIASNDLSFEGLCVEAIPGFDCDYRVYLRAWIEIEEMIQRGRYTMSAVKASIINRVAVPAE